MRILLSYPETFTDAAFCASRIQRLTRHHDNYVLVYPGMNSGVALECGEELGCEVELAQSNVSPENLGVTHAILFHTGHDPYVEQCQALAIPYREVGLEISTVGNVDRGDDYDVYIGRGSVFGNPYALGVDGDRNEVIRKFEYDFLRGLLTDRLTGLSLKELALRDLRGKKLGCHCKPAACHGDVIARFVNSHR